MAGFRHFCPTSLLFLFFSFTYTITHRVINPVHSPQAGCLCKEVGNENLAFVLLNRYVDLTEAIDEQNVSLLDNTDFAEATNVPVLDNTTLPTKQVGSACLIHLVV